MNPLIKYITESSKIIDISDTLQKSDKTNLSLIGLNDSAKASVAYALTMRGKKSSIIVCSNVMQAKKLMQDLKFFSELEIIYFPAKILNYYDTEAESKEIENQRMYAIEKILSKEQNIIVTTVEALLVKMFPYSTYDNINIKIKKDEDINLKELVENLVKLGYEKSDIVEGKGQFAIRGGLIDIFAINNELPYRIELFGDTVDNIRTFDSITQRSIDTLNSIEISFLNEVCLSEEKRNKVILKLEELIARNDIKQELKDIIARDIEKIQEHNEDTIVDKYFEILLDKPSCLLDYLNNYNIFINEYENCKQKANNTCYENNETLKILAERNYLYIPYANKYISFEDLEKSISKRNSICLESINKVQRNIKSKIFEFDIKENIFYRNAIDIVLSDVKKAKDKVVLLVFSTDARVEQVKNYLIDNKIRVKYLENIYVEKELKVGNVYITKDILSAGFSSDEMKILVISELVSGVNYSSKKNNKTKDAIKKNRIGKSINSFEDLEIGDYIVHETHGIGIYQGVHTINVAGIKKDYIKLEYANNGVLYIPINQLDSVTKYVCDDSSKPKINSLNSKEWQRTKSKVATHVKEIAKELVTLYAKRENTKGYAFSKDTPWQKEFEDSFEYELTEDQKIAVEEIKADMEQEQVMDRLLCGDVGYGKTEVALRAAFKAAMDSKQVAYLTPTTVLALQQYKTFKERMEPFGIKVELLSRFKTPKQQIKIIKDLVDGKIDIIVGTHRVLSKDVFFKDLGLLIIDEEHRFGVKAKESIKMLKENIDVLSMTATPIPRTLHMSMVGIRSLSTLSEPPLERLPVHTYVLEYDERVIKDAIEKEMLRDGQIIYLNNRVDNIEQIAKKVSDLVPEARIGIVHGQMDVHQVENIMLAFMNHEIDILVCTTIVESGIDIPNANTLIVENSDNLGLAQLYQIRGRVGRSNRLAYAYMTYQKDKQISEVSQKRLKAIKDFAEFGSGQKIALRDLEIRGAGNLLGKQQHGHMINVGYEMYLSLLEKAIKNEKEGKDDSLKKEEMAKEVKIDLNVSAYISDSYISNPLQKITMYQKISDISNEEEMMDVIDELLDRYGDIPKETENLIKIVEIRNIARKIGITRIHVQNGYIVFEPSKLKYQLTNINSSDILIHVQLELKKLLESFKEKG